MCEQFLKYLVQRQQLKIGYDITEDMKGFIKERQMYSKVFPKFEVDRVKVQIKPKFYQTFVKIYRHLIKLFNYLDSCSKQLFLYFWKNNPNASLAIKTMAQMGIVVERYIAYTDVN